MLSNSSRSLRSILLISCIACTSILADHFGGNSLHSAADAGNVESLWKLLFKGEHDVNGLDVLERTALHVAAGYRNEVTKATIGSQMVKMLVMFGGDLHSKDEEGKTALHWACLEGNVDTATTLIELGAQVNAKDNLSWTPLHFAAAEGHTDLVKLLLKSGASADRDGLTREGKTAKEMATIAGKTEIAAILS